MENYRKYVFNKALDVCTELMQSLYGNKCAEDKPDFCMVLPGFINSGTRVQLTTSHNLPEKDLNRNLVK